MISDFRMPITSVSAVQSIGGLCLNRSDSGFSCLYGLNHSESNLGLVLFFLGFWGLTHSSTAKQEEKQEEGGTSQPLQTFSLPS